MPDDDRGSLTPAREASGPRAAPTQTDGDDRASSAPGRRIAGPRMTAPAPAAIVALNWIRRAVWTTWFLGLVLFVVTWPVGSLAPVPGLDYSFVAGLHMAAHEHLQFGTQVVGTYGPLGFLAYPVLPHGLEGLRSFLWRSYQRAIGLTDRPGPVRDYSIVPDTVIDGLVMSVPAAADFPGAFSLNPRATQLAVRVIGGSTGILTYRFYEQRITSLAAPTTG